MIRPPHRIVRRTVVAPVVVAGSIAGLGALPVGLVAAAFASRFVPGRWRVLRVAWFSFLYAAMQSVGLVTLFGLWIGSGFGWRLHTPRFVEAHHRLMATFLRLVMGSARRTFQLRFSVDESATDRLRDDRPIIVMSQHAGPGDSFLLVDALVNSFGRRTRIVLKDVLQWDPCIDVMLNRLPNRFVPSQGRAGPGALDAIADLTSTMGPGDAFVIFPEGGNYTEKRRVRAIDRLRAIGRRDLAARAEKMQTVMPPKPGGALAALDAAPGADVLFVGHVGLEELSTVRDLWRGLPMDADIVVTWWIVPHEEIPPAPEREAWLYDRWATLDAWVVAARRSRRDVGEGLVRVDEKVDDVGEVG